MSTPADSDARRRFVERHDRNFAVVAAAGAGKTRAIVDRIVAIADRDLEAVGNLVVVTYTNTAAREFKRRVTATVLERSRASRAPSVLASLDRAFFGTIHSFCLGLLSDHQLELGFPSRLQTITPVEGRRLWEDFLNRPEADQLIRSHPLTIKLLRFCPFDDLLAVANRMESAQPRVHPGEPPTALDPSPLEVPRLRERNAEARLKMLHEFHRYNRALQSADEFVGLPDLDSASDGLKPVCREIFRPLSTWLEDAAGDWASDLVALYCRQRHRDGLLTFNDQIGVTVSLLQRPKVLDRIRRRQFCVILDEAQDTDPRMFDVLVEISRPPGSEWKTWPGEGAPPRPGAFVMVGDPRQTIYDRAGTKRYLEIIKNFQMGKGGESLEFSVTHRCSVRVVETINRLFAGLQDGAAPFDNLEPAGTAIAGAAVRLPLRRSDPAQTHVNEVFRDEVCQVADWLRRVGEGGVGVHRWGQVAILAPRHDWLETCSAALQEAGIKHGLFRPRTTWRDQPGFTWPLSLLYTLIHPWDRFERLGVLREIFAISDHALVQWTALGSTTDAGLLDALETLESLERRLWRNQAPSIIEFVHEMCERLRLRERLQLLNDPGLALDSFLARAYEATHEGVSIEAWVRSLLDLLDEHAPVQNRRPDAIDLVTIHSAKGLEWEVIIPLGLGRAVVPQESPPYPHVVDPGRLPIGAGRWAGVVWNAFSTRFEYAGKPDGDEERRRLLYVALTRARRALVIPYGENFYKQPKNSLAGVTACSPAFLPEPDCLDINVPLEQRELPLDVLTFDPSAVQRAAHLSQAHPQLSRPHALADDAERTERFLEGIEGAFDFGRWWHGWVEHFPWLGSPDDHVAYCRQIPADLTFGARAVQEAQRFLESEAFRLLLAEGRHFRCEAPFSFCDQPAVWMEGVIDLLVQTRAGETWILDWKTNQPAPGQDQPTFLSDLRQKYLPQLAAYQKALEQGFGVRVGRLLIYSTVVGRFA